MRTCNPGKNHLMKHYLIRNMKRGRILIECNPGDIKGKRNISVKEILKTKKMHKMHDKKHKSNQKQVLQGLNSGTNIVYTDILVKGKTVDILIAHRVLVPKTNIFQYLIGSGTSSNIISEFPSLIFL